MTTFFKCKNFKFLFLIVFNFIFVNAQEVKTKDSINSTNNFWTNVRLGGGIGASFGNEYSNFSITPAAVYQFNDQFATGIGLNGNYANRKDYFEASVFGASVIALFSPVEELQLSAEFEHNNVNLKDKIIDSTTNYWYPALFLGGGYVIGDFGAIGMRFDVLYNDRKSVYGSAIAPFIRVFF